MELQDEANIPTPLTSGATDEPNAQQTAMAPPLPQGYLRAGEKPTAPPLPQGYTRPSAAPVTPAATNTVSTPVPAAKPAPVSKGAVAPAAPKQDLLTTADKYDYAVPAAQAMTVKAARGVRGLYHGIMGDEEQDVSKGQTTTASPAAASLGFTPEHLGYEAGSAVRGIGKFVKEGVQDLAGNTPIVVPNKEAGAPGWSDPTAHTLVAKYVTAPSMAEREASQKEMEEYFKSQGPGAAGHAISAFLHGTLGEYVPAIGPLAMSIEDQAQKGDLGGALTQVASLYALDHTTGTIKDGLKERINTALEKAKETPELKQAKANIDATAQAKDAAQKKLDAALLEHNKYAASHAQGIDSPKPVKAAYVKAQAALDEATAHHELAKEHAAKVQAAQPSITNKIGNAAGRVVSPLVPKAAEVPAEDIEAQPVLGKLGEEKPQAKPALTPINVKGPGEIRTEHIGEPLRDKPVTPLGRIELANNQGTVGKQPLLGEGTPEGPQIPKGGLPKIETPKQEVLPPEKSAKPERGNVKALTVDEKGNVIDKEDTLEGRVHKLLLEGLKDNTSKAAPVESTEAAPTEQRAGDRRVSDETHEGDERRQSERRVLKQMNDKLFQQSVSGQSEGRVDTDAYAKAMQQARKELGPDASVRDVMKRRDELVAPEAKGTSGDVGEQARQANPEPTRAETKAKPALPKEEPTGYAAKKEETIHAGEEGREDAKSAAEYHPVVAEQVNALSDDNLRKLATAHGLNPDEYDFKARDERRHRVERDQLAKDITEQMGDDEKINIGRGAERINSEGAFENKDMTGKSKAERAEKLFPRLRGPVDEYGNPSVSGGAPDEKDTKLHSLYKQMADVQAEAKTGGLYDLVGKLSPLMEEAKKTAGGYYQLEDWTKKNLPPEPTKATGYSQKADKRYPATAGVDAEAEKLKEHVNKTSSKDTDHIQRAMKELGPDAKLSDVMKKAQDYKTEAAKPVDLKRVGSEHNKSEGLGDIDTTKVAKDSRGADIAKAYGEMKHEPNSPEVKKSYDALIDDTKKQWNALEKSGIKIEPVNEDPYKSHEEMMNDLKNNKTLKVFRGGNPLPEDHPLAKIDPKTGESYNTMFRAVHDAFGHAMPENDFSETGEENAWNTHKQMMSKEAIPAMTTETKGQTSWFFNHGEEPGKFAEQKAGILPEHMNVSAADAKSALDHMKAGKDYSVLTAENPENSRISDEENAKKNKAMLADLHKNGYEPVPVEGHNADVQGNKEHSYFVPDMPADEAAEFGKRYKQAAVLTSQGLHDLEKDTVNPSDNKNIIIGDEAKKQKYYSTVGDVPFSVPLDFDKTEAPKASEASQHTYQYSQDGNKHSVDAIDKDGNHRAIVHASSEDGDPNTWTVRASYSADKGKGIGANSYARLAEAAKSEATRSGKPVTVQGDTDMTEAAKRTWQKLGERGYDVKWNDGRPSITFNGDEDRPKATAATARMSDGELLEHGFTQEDIDAGKHLPTVSGGAQSAGAAEAKSKNTTPEDLQKTLPDLSQKHLTDEEKASITTTATGKPRTAGTQKFIQNMEKIPSVQEYIDIAQQGEGARKWYSRSTAAFDVMHDEAPDYFKKGDKEKFMGVLAGSSPQQSVAMNLRETLGFWKEWNDEGRPKFDLDKWKQFGEAADKAWKEDGSPRARGMAKGASMHWDYAPTGAKWKAENLLLKNLTLPETKVPNIIKALNGEQMWPDLSKNAAFKAPSFAENLRKWIDGKSTGTKNVTNDSWMGLFGGIDKSALSKPENYHPLSVATRAAAEALGWEPEEAQAAIWSFTQALTEKGVEDPEIVRHYSEDFKDLLDNDLETREKLEGLGVNLDQLDEKLKRIEDKPEVSGRSTPTTSHSVGQLRSRIEEARGKGAIPEPKSVQGNLFRENPSFEHRAKPGEGHYTQPRDEATRFNPDEFKDEENPLGKLGDKKKKSPLGRI